MFACAEWALAFVLSCIAEMGARINTSYNSCFFKLLVQVEDQYLFSFDNKKNNKKKNPNNFRAVLHLQVFTHNYLFRIYTNVLFILLVKRPAS